MKVKTVIYTAFIIFILYIAVSTVIASNSGIKSQIGIAVADFGLDNNRYEWGLSACDWILDDSPYNTEILKRKTDLLVALERYDEAVLVQKSIVTYNPGSMDAEDWETFGALSVETGDYKGAVLSYEEALSEYKNLLPSGLSASTGTGSSSLHKKAELLIKLQRYDEAVVVYNSILEDDPEDVAAWIGLGDAYLYDTLLTDGQIDDMYAALDINKPDDYKSAKPVITSFASHKKAVDAYNRAVKIDPFVYPLVAAKILGGYEKTISSYQDILEGMNR